ncbi:hypothetical protein CEXT_28471 [Caerostris extrusa]|uniref:Uncharacterized protein n=1 Tax=Caerostris extrusa TaxID=172846 RepID=A0AAV4TGN9_CAEEX|nr:hypothetical protein CEXT_28471 [Caerostris extrusa]
MSASTSDLTFRFSFFSIDMVTSGTKLTWLSRNDSLLNLDKLAVISIFPLRGAVSIIGADALNSSNDFMSVTVVVCGYGGDDLSKIYSEGEIAKRMALLEILHVAERYFSLV